MRGCRGRRKKLFCKKVFSSPPATNQSSFTGQYMNKQKVIVAMSGGVDSSVAAAFAQKSGYEVLGVTLNLKHPDENFSKAQQCAGKSDRLAVEDVCRKLEIEHFSATVTPKIYELLDKYKCGREVIIFKTREETNEYFN
jgi:tRNA(Ile)-lysidine synthase TilS/MesJ